MSKQVIVLGFYRSGTSMVGGILYRLGVPMGATGQDADKANPKGYYEDRKLAPMNAKIIEDINKAHKKIRKHFLNIDLDDIKSIDTTEYEKKVKKSLEVRDKKYEIWGLKDPRIVPFLDLYLPHLTNPHFIIVARERKSIKASLNKRRPAKKNSKFVDRQLDTVYCPTYDRVRKKYPTLVLSYEDILTFPKDNVEQIAKFIGVDVKEKAISFIDRDLWRN